VASEENYKIESFLEFQLSIYSYLKVHRVERNSRANVGRRNQTFFQQLKATGSCIVHRIAACTLPMLLCMYVCAYIRTLLRASKSPYRSRIFGTRSTPASRRTNEP